MIDKRYQLSHSELIKLLGEVIVLGASSWDKVKGQLADIRILLDGQKKKNETYDINLRDLALLTNRHSNGTRCRLGFSVQSGADLFEKLDKVEDSITSATKRKQLKSKGIFFSKQSEKQVLQQTKKAFLFPGQGTQYVNMLKDLTNKYSIIREIYHETDIIMEEITGRSITELIFISDGASVDEVMIREMALLETDVMQPAILAADYALYRLICSFGITPDVVAGLSLGEYGALVAADVLSFRDALVAVSTRGKEMDNIHFDDKGKMAGIFADYHTVNKLIREVPGYVISANKNSYAQTVISGETSAVIQAMDVCAREGLKVIEIPVSHAFHSKIVAHAGAAFRRILDSLEFKSPKIDVLSNLTADYYPRGTDSSDQIREILERHFASPVEFVAQVERMLDEGVGVFIEVGPKRALTQFVGNIAGDRTHLAVATNHPKQGGLATLNDSLAALAVSGIDIDWQAFFDAESMEVKSFRKQHYS